MLRSCFFLFSSSCGKVEPWYCCEWPHKVESKDRRRSKMGNQVSGRSVKKTKGQKPTVKSANGGSAVGDVANMIKRSASGAVLLQNSPQPQFASIEILSKVIYRTSSRCKPMFPLCFTRLKHVSFSRARVQRSTMCACTWYRHRLICQLINILVTSPCLPLQSAQLFIQALMQFHYTCLFTFLIQQMTIASLFMASQGVFFNIFWFWFDVTLFLKI